VSEGRGERVLVSSVCPLALRSRITAVCVVCVCALCVAQGAGGAGWLALASRAVKNKPSLPTALPSRLCGRVWSSSSRLSSLVLCSL
jgi:hypothetical protein